MSELTDTKIKKLLREAFACYGVLAEAKAKCVLHKRAISRERKGTSKIELDHEAMNRSIKQIRSDLAKYSKRIIEIHEELKSYGVFSNLAKVARTKRR